MLARPQEELRSLPPGHLSAQARQAPGLPPLTISFRPLLISPASSFFSNLLTLHTPSFRLSARPACPLSTGFVSKSYSAARVAPARPRGPFSWCRVPRMGLIGAGFVLSVSLLFSPPRCSQLTFIEATATLENDLKSPVRIPFLTPLLACSACTGRLGWGFRKAPRVPQAVTWWPGAPSLWCPGSGVCHSSLLQWCAFFPWT